MLVDQQAKAQLYAELRRVLKECATFGYHPSYFRNDLANSDPEELWIRYTTNPPTEGYMRLVQERRLDLAVENVVWHFREHFSPEIVKRARQRLAEFGFDALTQQHRSTS